MHVSKHLWILHSHRFLGHSFLLIGAVLLEHHCWHELILVCHGVILGLVDEFLLDFTSRECIQEERGLLHAVVKVVSTAAVVLEQTIVEELIVTKGRGVCLDLSQELSSEEVGRLFEEDLLDDGEDVGELIFEASVFLIVHIALAQIVKSYSLVLELLCQELQRIDG